MTNETSTPSRSDEALPLTFLELVAAISSGTATGRGGTGAGSVPGAAPAGAAPAGGENAVLARLFQGEKLRVETPFVYPGRQGQVVVEVAMVSENRVRFSDGGLLLQCLVEQGMDVQADMILSRTVFHAAKQFPGAGILRGQLCLDCQPETMDVGLWTFLQMVVEIVGLRHCKYKEALIQFEKRRDADTRSTGWRPS